MEREKVFKVHVQGIPTEMLGITSSRIYKILWTELRKKNKIKLSVKPTSERY